MKFLHLAVMLVFVFAACNKMEESSEPLNPAKAITATAEKLNKAVLTQDFKTFAKHTHPVIIEQSGGEQKFIEMMEKGAKEMKAAGVQLLSITNGEPGKIITKNGELQSTLPQVVEMRVPKGHVKSKTTLIAISKDQGKTWRFVDTFNSDLKILQSAMPNLSNELVIPPSQQPEFINK
jgi:hypothetical protein